MKPFRALCLAALSGWALPGLLAQEADYAYDTDAAYPGDYAAVSPQLPPPDLSSPYAGPTLLEPEPSNQSRWDSGSSQGRGDGQSIGYQFLEVGYRYTDPRGGRLDGSHGLGASLSLALFEPFFIRASMNWTSGSGQSAVRGRGRTDADYELATVSIGGGAYYAITDRLHLVGEVGVIYADLDSRGHNLSYSDLGVYVRPSLRFQALEWLELQAGLTLTSADDYDSRLFDVSAYFQILPKLDLNLGLDLGNETRSVRAGARLRW